MGEVYFSMCYSSFPYKYTVISPREWDVGRPKKKKAIRNNVLNEHAPQR